MLRSWLKIVAMATLPVWAGDISWFAGSIPAGSYGFGGATRAELVGAALRYTGDAAAYGGFQLVRDACVDVRDRQSWELEMRVRGRAGDAVWVGLEDARGGTQRFHTRLPLDGYGGLDTAWRTMRVPLTDFSSLGEFWDVAKNAGQAGLVDWGCIRALRISSDPVTGRTVPVVAEFSAVKMVRKAVAGQAAAVPDNAKVLPTPQLRTVLYNGNILAGSTFYSYGGRTQWDVQKGKERPVLALALDGREYSGGVLLLGNAQDLTSARNTLALSFFVRGDAAKAQFYVGLLDDESEGVNRAVETRVRAHDYAAVRDGWVQVVIPLRDFPEMGVWWNPEMHSNVVGKFDWSRVKGFRIATDRLANRRPQAEEMLALQLDQIALVDVPESLFDAQTYWKNFSSTQADVLLEDFSDAKRNQGWRVQLGEGSRLTYNVSAAAEGAALVADYALSEWATLDQDWERSGLPTDWSKWRALRMKARGFERYSRLAVLLVDSTNEAWVAQVELKADWENVQVNFSDFHLFEYWQPDNAVPNRKLDLGRIRAVSLRSLEYNQKGRFAVDDLTLTNAVATVGGVVRTAAVRYNQQGYLPKDVKRALVTNFGEERFLLLDSLGKKVFEAPLVYNGEWSLSGDSVWLADFSEFTTPGRYTLWVNDSVRSGEFRIGGSWLQGELRAALKSYYLTRSGMEMTKKYAGIYARPKTHADDKLLFHKSMERAGTWDGHGGWYDAGDYGKYVVNGGVSVATLLLAYEMHPRAMQFDNLGIPESGNRIPDVLDEARYELEWFLRMQDKDGGVFFKVAADNWDGFVNPANTSYTRRVVGKSTASTLNFAAAVAQAAGVYAPFDKAFAKRCLAAAQRAYAWALANAAVPFPPYTEGSGAYDDSRFEDEFFWAEAMLWRVTGSADYKTAVLARMENVPVQMDLSWQNTGNLGWIALGLQTRDADLQARARSGIAAMADKIVAEIEGSEFRVATSSFYWGSNGVVLNRALLVGVQNVWRRDEKMRNALVEVVDYINGRNAVGTHFVIGMVDSSPKNPHHRLIASDGVEAPIPGLLVGGVNADREDDVAKDPLGVRYPFSEPGRAYYDHQAAYASNETCINWNAPLVWVLGTMGN